MSNYALNYDETNGIGRVCIDRYASISLSVWAQCDGNKRKVANVALQESALYILYKLDFNTVEARHPTLLVSSTPFPY